MFSDNYVDFSFDRKGEPWDVNPLSSFEETYESLVRMLQVVP